MIEDRLREDFCDYLTEGELKILRLDGDTDAILRHNFCHEFQEPIFQGRQIGLFSTKAGGCGITLTKAIWIFFVD